MDYNVIFFGILFLFLSYLLAVKKQTWLLNGFNEKKVRDKDKLGKVVGIYLFVPLGVFMIITGIVCYPYMYPIMTSVFLISITTTIVYVQKKLVDYDAPIL